MASKEETKSKSIPQDAVVKGPNKIVSVKKLLDNCAG
jgi:hypothetical protein